jgi:hypothetical protein
MFEPIDIIPLGFEKKKFRSHSKINLGQQYAS